MKKILTFALCGMIAAGMTGCKDKKNEETKTDTATPSAKEVALEKAMKPYVENTVIATYSNMASEGITLLRECEQILTAVENDQDYTDLMRNAGLTWRRMRVYWEQSEAFLFGPAEKHNIDPHIDAWPLDFNEMNRLLSDDNRMAAIEEQGGAYVGDMLGYALKGFHAAEYLLFTAGQPHACNLTHAQAVYLVGIVEDLAQQAILLEDCWAGTVSAEKEAVITDSEGESMSYGENWGEYFINAGKAGSIYKTYQEAAEQVIEGCVTIAGEVADLKMGNPYKGSDNGGDSEYLESPYSRTSTIDFADNIRSIQNAYQGAKEGDASISDYVKSVDDELDNRVKVAIAESIGAIESIIDFETKAQGNSDVEKAINKVSALSEILNNEVLPLLSK